MPLGIKNSTLPEIAADDSYLFVYSEYACLANDCHISSHIRDFIVASIAQAKINVNKLLS
jgi:hypothetical protein